MSEREHKPEQTPYEIAMDLINSEAFGSFARGMKAAGFELEVIKTPGIGKNRNKLTSVVIKGVNPKTGDRVLFAVGDKGPILALKDWV